MQVPFFDPKHFNGAVELHHLGIVECLGADACHFLHQQLTQELMALPAGSSTMAGFCNAKGRLQASMVVFKVSNEQLYLVLKKDLLERTLKRLSMFVLRAKVKLQNATEGFKLIGAMGSLAMLPSTQEGLILKAPLQSAIGTDRALFLAHVSFNLEEFHSTLSSTLNTERWLLSETLSGVAWVEERTFEHFVPQMLNFESSGAISFKKGCYPGQEVVARSQFRGTLKKRTVIVFSLEPLNVGMELFSALHSSESCAEIVQVSRYEDFYVALACFQIETLMKAIDPDQPEHSFNDFLKRDAFWTQSFGLSAQMDTELNLGFYPLPYLLLDDI